MTRRSVYNPCYQCHKTESRITLNYRWGAAEDMPRSRVPEIGFCSYNCFLEAISGPQLPRLRWFPSRYATYKVAGYTAEAATCSTCNGSSSAYLAVYGQDTHFDLDANENSFTFFCSVKCLRAELREGIEFLKEHGECRHFTQQTECVICAYVEPPPGWEEGDWREWLSQGQRLQGRVWETRNALESLGERLEQHLAVFRRKSAGDQSER